MGNRVKSGEMVVVGLGLGGKDGIPMGAWEAMRAAGTLMLRTEKHPAAGWLREQGIHFHTYDALSDDQAIAEDLLRRMREGEGIVYAVPGHPFVEKTVKLLQERCAAEGVRLKWIGSESFLDRAVAVFGFDPSDGFQLVAVDALNARRLQPHYHLLITQVSDRRAASAVKRALMELYPGDFLVAAAHALGTDAEERIERVPLHALDTLEGYGASSVVYVPAADRDEVHYRTFEKLHEIVSVLRSPEGCPWDREQTHRSLRKYFIEEVFEAVETIDNEDIDAMREELGDVLLQIMLHSQIEEEQGRFSVYDVIAGLSEKLVRRHPHVFGEVQAETAEDVKATWAAVKAQEKASQGIEPSRSILDGIPSTLPALMRSVELQKKAAKVGFDWEEPGQIAEKIREELQEFLEVLENSEGDERKERMLDEMGDLLFAVVNLARFLKLDPDEALARTNRKFMRRFQHIEERLRLSGKSFDQTDIQEMESYWQEAKRS